MVKSKIKIEADDKGVAQTVDRVTRNFNNAERQIQGFGRGVSGTLSSITGMATSIPLLLGSAAVGIGAFAAKGVSEFREFDKGLRNINTIVNVSDGQLNRLGDSVQRLSMKYGLATGELNNAVYQAVSAGVDVTKVMEFMDTASTGSIAGLSSVTESVDVLTTVMNSYKLEAGEATSVSDLLFQTVKLGKTTYSELASSLSQVTPLAASSGVEFEQISAAIATLTKQGVPTAQAVTQIRAALVAMNEVLGDGWADTMTLQEGMAAMSEKADGSNKKLKEMVGKIEGLNAILGTTGANFRGATSDLDAMNTSLGATNTAFGQQEQSLDFKLNRLAETINYLAVKLGEELVPALSETTDFIVDDLIPAIKGTIHWFDESTESIKSWGKGWDDYFNESARNDLNWLGDKLNDVGIGQYFDVHVVKTKQAVVGVKALSEEYGHLYGLNEILYGKVEKPFNMMVASASEATNTVIELTEEQKKALAELEKQWVSTSTTLSNEIATAPLNQFDTELYNINAKVDELHKKFGDKPLIKEYGEALSSALVNNMVSTSMTELILEEEELFDKTIELMDAEIVASIEASQIKKDLIREEMELRKEQIANEEELQRGRMESYSASFGNMAQASQVFYQLSGQQSKSAFNAYKLFSITEAAMSTYNAANAALLPPPVGLGPLAGIPLAASTIVLGLANVARISAMTPGSAGSGGSTGGGYSPSIPTGSNYDNSTTNAQTITINIESGWQSPDELVEKIVPALEKYTSYGGSIKIN